ARALPAGRRARRERLTDAGQGGRAVIRVLLADDQDVVRLGLRVLVDSEEDLTIVGDAADGLRVVELAKQVRPDVILMDVRMPGVDGIEATRRIVADPQLTAVRIIVLTTFEVD